MLAWAALLIASSIYLHALDPLPPGAKGWQRFWKGAGILMLLFGGAMLIGMLAGNRQVDSGRLGRDERQNVAHKPRHGLVVGLIGE